MNIQKLYQDLKENKITKNQFLFQVRKDSRINRFFSPLNSFDETVKILKSKQLLFESLEQVKTENFRDEDEEYTPPMTMKQVIDQIGSRAKSFGDVEKVKSFLKANRDKLTSDLVNDIGGYYGLGADELGSTTDYVNETLKTKEVPNPDAGKFIIVNDKKRRVVDKTFDSKEAASDYLRKNPNLHGNNVSLKTIKLGATHKVYSTKEGLSLSVKETQDLNESAKPKKDIDHVNPYEFKKGVYYELELQSKKGLRDVEKAKAIVLKNLNKNSNFYTDMTAGEDDSKQEAHEMREATASNLIDKLNGLMPVKESLKKLLNDIIK